MNPVSQKTMADLYMDTKKKVKFLKDQGYRVVEKWGCELEKELEDDEEMKQFFVQNKIVDPYSHAMHSMEDVPTQQNYYTSSRRRED